MSSKIVFRWFFLFVFFGMDVAVAATPLWTFTPLTATEIVIPVNDTATVQYTVRNQSTKSKNLVMQALPGVMQTSSCQLAPKGQQGDSCLLNLHITGGQLPEKGIHEGPVLCQKNADGSPNMNQCYQPASDQRLNINITKECNKETFVNAPAGAYCGFKSEDKPVVNYLGIKYANAERWQPPFPVQNSHSQVINATHLSPVCPQENDDGLGVSEDCLFLNVWVPEALPMKDKRPVMLFIHGGAFVFGSGNRASYNGVNLVSEFENIIVTINYRLGVLGALAPQLPNETGNFGILDQIAAINWVYENIEAFGGDRENITLVGQSAGAMSVGILVHIPEVASKVKKAIMESNPYGIPYKPYFEAKDIADLFAQLCPDNSCNLEEILAAQKKVVLQNIPSLLEGFNEILTWAPYIDDILIQQQPLLQPLQLPVIIGTNRDEGIQFVAPLENVLNDATYRLFVRAMFDRNGHTYSRDILAEPRYSTRSQSAFDAMQHLITDYLFTCPSRLALSTTTALQNFGYGFDYIASYNNFPSQIRCATNVCHSDELPFVFQNALVLETQVPVIWTPEDKAISLTLGEFWSNFFKTGMTEGNWQPYSAQQQRLDIVTPTDLQMIDYSLANCGLWDMIGYELGS